MGEDIVATQLVLPPGHVLRPVDLGAIAAAGHTTIVVARRPRVAILPTGSELVPVGTVPDPGAILEYNSIVLAAQINTMGGMATRFPIVKDDPQVLWQAIDRAAQDHDLIMLNAGSSAGAEDFASSVIADHGEVLVHGVAVRPGHPVIFGMLHPDQEGDRPIRPIVGVPGYPVSAALTVEIFVRPLIDLWLGKGPHKPVVVRAEITRKITSPAGDEDHVRVVLGRVGHRLLAAPLPTGAGVITSLVQADGIVIVPPGIQGLESGEAVDVNLYVPAANLEQTILCIGSHDVALDVLAQSLAHRGRRLASSNVGSVGGLMALRRGTAHIAGCHLLDPKTGEYNVPYIRQYMPDIPVRVVTVVQRQQGLMVLAGNPLHLHTLQDLAEHQARFANRQRGSGTRLLLDHHLLRLGIPISSIDGYDHEEYTHLSVAASIASGRADCGLGIAAAASALNLDFIPLFSERFDLVVPREFAHSELVRPVFELLGSRAFQVEVASLPGYDSSPMGTVVLED